MKVVMCILLDLVLLSADVASAGKRVTRVINGELVLGRDSGYNPVRYFASLGTLHGTSSVAIFVYTFYKQYGHLSCGGALITPTIIQTACHCVSYKEDRREKKPARVKNGWEDNVKVYIGANEEFGGTWSMDRMTPLVSKKFVNHQRCCFNSKDVYVGLSYDFAWIIVDRKWSPFLTDSNRIDFAPIYTSKELDSTWDLVHEKESVCLHVGFGPHIEDQYLDNKRMRHGWSVATPETLCIWWSGLDRFEQEVSDEIRSWACFMPFSRHFQSTAHGDSGSPVSCYNQYFAVVSGGTGDFEFDNGPNFVDHDDALRYAKFENAKDFRSIFQLTMDEYVNSKPKLRSLKKGIDFRATSHPSDNKYEQDVTSSIPTQRNYMSLSILAVISVVHKIFS